MTTDSDTVDRTAHRTPHTADDPGETPNASPRTAAHARQQLNTALTHGHELWRGWRAELVPPSTWTEPWPPVRELWLYARYGAWAGETGVWRIVGVIYAAVVALPVVGVLRNVAWMFERPTRFLVATVLYVAVAHTDIGRSLLPWPTWLP